MDKSKIVIVVPAYKPTLDDASALSLQLLKKFCSEFDWVLIHPMGMQFTFDTSEFTKLPLSKRHFKNVTSYSRLCMNPRFYEHFQHYEYMLIYQLDAYALKDELLFWCNKGYSYIGSPLFVKKWLQKSFIGRKFKSILKRIPILKQHLPLHRYQVGNGGLSLRQIQDAIKVLRSNQLYFSKIQYNYYNKRIPYYAWAYALIKKHKCKADIVRRLCLNVPEDAFWASYAKFLYKDFQFATLEDAHAFSFDSRCKQRLKLTNNKLPFGIHQNADKKYYADFIEILTMLDIGISRSLLKNIENAVYPNLKKQD